MNAVEKLKMNVDHMAMYLDAAKAALSAKNSPESHALAAAQVSLKGAEAFMPKLMSVLKECSQEGDSTAKSPWDDPNFSLTK